MSDIPDDYQSAKDMPGMRQFDKNERESRVVKFGEMVGLFERMEVPELRNVSVVCDVQPGGLHM